MHGQKLLKIMLLTVLFCCWETLTTCLSFFICLLCPCLPLRFPPKLLCLSEYLINHIAHTEHIHYLSASLSFLEVLLSLSSVLPSPCAPVAFRPALQLSPLPPPTPTRVSLHHSPVWGPMSSIPFFLCNGAFLYLVEHTSKCPKTRCDESTFPPPNSLKCLFSFHLFSFATFTLGFYSISDLEL